MTSSGSPVKIEKVQLPRSLQNSLRPYLVEDIEILQTEFTLWLIPREPVLSALRSIVRSLAANLDAVEFEPHLTVYSGRSTETQARAVATTIASAFPPIEMTAIGLEHTKIYTKTLFVQFEQSTLVRKMFEAARNYDPRSNYVLNPHLSLLYKRLSEHERRALCNTLDFPTGLYIFNRVRLVETETPIEDAGPVQRWRTAFEEPLRGT